MATIPGPTGDSAIGWVPLQGRQQSLMQGFQSMTFAMQIVGKGTILLLITRNSKEDQITKAFWYLDAIKIQVDTISGLGTLISGVP